MLGQFDFEPRSLMQFVRHCAENYLTDENREVRLEAVHTCCQLLTPALMKVQSKHSQTLVITIQVLIDLIQYLYQILIDFSF